MAWDSSGRYYYRSRRQGQRVRREYVGTGVVGDLAARIDELGRREDAEQRGRERARLHAEQARVEPLDHETQDVDGVVEALARLALLTAGYRQHDRGQWRKRRRP